MERKKTSNSRNDLGEGSVKSRSSESIREKSAGSNKSGSAKSLEPSTPRGSMNDAPQGATCATRSYAHHPHRMITH